MDFLESLRNFLFVRCWRVPSSQPTSRENIRGFSFKYTFLLQEASYSYRTSSKAHFPSPVLSGVGFEYFNTGLEPGTPHSNDNDDDGHSAAARFDPAQMLRSIKHAVKPRLHRQCATRSQSRDSCAQPGCIILNLSPVMRRQLTSPSSVATEILKVLQFFPNWSRESTARRRPLPVEAWLEAFVRAHPPRATTRAGGGGREGWQEGRFLYL